MLSIAVVLGLVLLAAGIRMRHRASGMFLIVTGSLLLAAFGALWVLVFVRGGT